MSGMFWARPSATEEQDSCLALSSNAVCSNTHLAFYDSKHNHYDDKKPEVVTRVLRLHPGVPDNFLLA